MIIMKDLHFLFKKKTEVTFRRRESLAMKFFASFSAGKEIFVFLNKIRSLLKAWKARLFMDAYTLEDLDDTTLETNDPYTIS